MVGPQMPSALIPTARWNSRSAWPVSSPRMPSSPAVEAERVQSVLEVGDVVAAQHGSLRVEEAVAEQEAALDECRPRLAADDPVDAQAARVLERPHRGLGAHAELAGLVGADVATDRGETRLEIANRLTATSAA